ncbi:MAG: hypothetical protein U0271_13410 [Polyangiaceae bacterium]
MNFSSLRWLALSASLALSAACLDFDQFQEGGAGGTGAGGDGAGATGATGAGGSGGSGGMEVLIDPACEGVMVPVRLCAFDSTYEFGTGYESDWTPKDVHIASLKQCNDFSTPAEVHECAVELDVRKGHRGLLGATGEAAAPEDPCFAAVRVPLTPTTGWALLGVTQANDELNVAIQDGAVRFSDGVATPEVVHPAVTADALRMIVDDAGTTQLEALSGGAVVACRRFTTPSGITNGFTTILGVDATDATSDTAARFREYGNVE